MNSPLTREIIRDCCTGREDEPAALANARPNTPDLLCRCIASGQVSAAQVIAHQQAGDLLEVNGPTTATPGPFDRYPDGMTRPSGRES